jgi:hypothetical protein
MIGDIKASNENLSIRNNWLEKEVNRLKEELIQKEGKQIEASELKLQIESSLSNKIRLITDKNR